ncbi:hypothetical protein [Prauserella cavernicola]|uniref:Secreted protein n=1 Tax=Prauserella cavernicola TaxID=2800127 RepID=A0A934QPY0_9PSEU|nr:hypothetical protein [Prauserella cavernicola]MBK1783903.1 hypothetical protein [Prauserella cavernicola]
MIKKAAFVAATAAGLMMLGGTAFASQATTGDDDVTSQIGLVNTGDILDTVGVCGNDVNVLGVQVTDILNGSGLSLPILSPAGGAATEVVSPEVCASSVEG